VQQSVCSKCNLSFGRNLRRSILKSRGVEICCPGEISQGKLQRATCDGIFGPEIDFQIPETAFEMFVFCSVLKVLE
jgi:hypothetical protein